jgi:DNA repair protein RadC
MNRSNPRASAPPCRLTADLFTSPSVCPPSPPRLPVPVFGVRLVRERDHVTALVRTPADAARVACEVLEGFDREVFLVLALSTAGRLIGVHAAHTGTLDASVASPREVFKFALLCNARSVVVAHNHPSGNLVPSSADVQVTRQLKAAGDVLTIPVVDSLVVGFDGQYTSLVERGLV